MSADNFLSFLLTQNPSEEQSVLPGPRLRTYGNLEAEWEAVTDGAALFDLQHSFCCRITGKDRIKFLNNFCTNNISLLQPGSGCEAFAASIKGRILGHFFLICETDSLLLFSLSGYAEDLLNHFRKYVLLDDVQFTELNNDYALFYVTGFNASAKLEELTETRLARWQSAEINKFEQPLTSIRIDLFDMPGYLLLIPQNDVVTHWKNLTDNGILAAGSDCFHTLRIESGLPLCGIDVTEKNLVHEAARTQSAVSFNKGCYLGQEPIARLETLGHTNQEIRSLSWDGAHTFSSGTPLFPTTGDKSIGHLTSSCPHPEGNRGLGLALLRREYLEPDTSVLLGEEADSRQIAVVM
ncbi:MAG: hypothetical protein KDA65_05965 [Planctomycetaceae bacterium]|nr:hypothetical protein [Planctomycetaceae bacterium]